MKRVYCPQNSLIDYNQTFILYDNTTNIISSIKELSRDYREVDFIHIRYNDGSEYYADSKFREGVLSEKDIKSVIINRMTIDRSAILYGDVNIYYDEYINEYDVEHVYTK